MENVESLGEELREPRPVLVVDDDELISSAVEFILVDEGYPVMVARNGQEALECAEKRHPSVILLDMKMPVMDGWAFAATYRARPGPHAPIIVMTAAHDSRHRAAEISAEGYISKPFDLDHLLDLVSHYASHG